VPAPPVCATGVQISVDKIAAMLAQYNGASQRALVKEQRSFGYWTPRRCDVYVVSYRSGSMHDRLELAALLWQHGVSADVLYESSVLDSQENDLESCLREGIL
jgi:translation initiation factor 2-alpha kinase 4